MAINRKSHFLGLAASASIWLAAAGVASAQSTTTALSGDDKLKLLLGLGVLILVLLLGVGIMLSNLQKTTKDIVKDAGDDVRKQYLQLPFGVPEGTMRGYISILVIVIGLAVLVLQDPLDIESSEAVAGFVSAVIAFYFVTRQQQEVRGALEDGAKTLRTTSEKLSTSFSAMLGASRGLGTPTASGILPAVLATIVRRAVAKVVNSGEFTDAPYASGLELGDGGMGLDAGRLVLFISAVERELKADPEVASISGKIALHGLNGSADNLLGGNMSGFVLAVVDQITQAG